MNQSSPSPDRTTAGEAAASPRAGAARPAAPRDAVGLLSGTLLLGLGERLCERFIPLFITRLGGGAAAVGLYQAAVNLVGAAAAVPGGYFADRIGSKRALQGCAVVASCAVVERRVPPRGPRARDPRGSRAQHGVGGVVALARSPGADGRRTVGRRSA